VRPRCNGGVACPLSGAFAHLGVANTDRSPGKPIEPVVTVVAEPEPLHAFL
jgi:hypothetical protein